MNAADREYARGLALKLLTSCLPQSAQEAALDVVTPGFRCWTPVHDWESGGAAVPALRRVISRYGTTAGPGTEQLPLQALVTDGEQVVVELGTARPPGQPSVRTTLVLVLNNGLVEEVRCYLDPEEGGRLT